MEKFSIRLILIVLLLVGGPTILKLVQETQQKEYQNTPVSDTDQASFDEETEECDSYFASPFLSPIKYYASQIPVNFYNPEQLCSSPNIIVLPPPKIK